MLSDDLSKVSPAHRPVAVTSSVVTDDVTG